MSSPTAAEMEAPTPEPNPWLDNPNSRPWYATTVELWDQHGMWADFVAFERWVDNLIDDSVTGCVADTPNWVNLYGEICKVCDALDSARQNAEALAAERVEVERLTKERDEANAACAEVLSSLEWTGDGYAWNPKHGDYRERVIDALDRGKRVHGAVLTANADEIRRLREALEFYAQQHNWKNDDGEYSDDSIAYDDKGRRAREALAPAANEAV